MSRKGVIAKRVKTAPDGHIENQRPNAQSGWPRNACSALGQNVFRPTECLGQSPTLGRSRTRPGKLKSRGRPTPRHKPRTTSARAGKRLAAAQLPRVPRCTPSEPGNYAHVRPRPSAKSYPSDHSRPTEIIRPRPFRLGRPLNIRPRPFRLGQRPDCPADRPNPHNSSPKPAPT
ncbi:unnamed protein product [Microthlaspi erraticum]|uniref:Uncharacterized protein n=1 Tax=Microthlaspi erraticum TaxID=1685480 RepID=A0A6D2JWM1_9BRAS|nr:unnamed protein product [Microthlaspi erraticum]